MIGDLSALIETSKRVDAKEAETAIRWLKESRATWVTVDFEASPTGQHLPRR